MRNKPKTDCDQRQLNLFDWLDEAPLTPTTVVGVEELALPEVDGVEFNLAGDGANTMIGYMYRDGDNYKRFKDVVLKGRLSRADIRRMFDTVFDHRLFLASQVGLEDLQMQFDNGWELEADHPWHEFREIAYVDDPPTADEHQNRMTTVVFVAKWPSTVEGWDNVGAEKRLINAMGLSEGSQKYLKESGC
jgi:hypothetical protein